MLESLESETPNIKDLNIEQEPSQSLLMKEFNKAAEEELTDELLDRMRKSLNEMKLDINHTDDLIGLYFLCPHLRSEMAIDQNYYEEILEKFRAFSSSPVSAAHWALLIQNFYPEKFIDLNLDNLKHELLSAAMERLSGDKFGDFGNFAHIATYYKKLFCNDQPFEYTPIIDRKLSTELGYLRRGSYDVVSLLSGIKLLYPNHFNQIEITERDLQKAKSHIQSSKDMKDWEDIPSQLYRMKILAAKKINFTNHGLKIETEQEYTQETPPVPKTRNF